MPATDRPGVGADPSAAAWDPEPAYAKINLRLCVFERDDTGYHGLETIFLRCGLHDRVAVQPGADGIELTVTGDEEVPASEANLCWRAADAFFACTGESPAVSIRLEKRIPVGAGLGGGSADAAVVLQLLAARSRTTVSEQQLFRLAGQLGSDVPFALLQVPMALGWERGRRLLPLRPPRPRPGLILLPSFRISTAEAYGWLDAEREKESGRTREKTADQGVEDGVLPGTARLADWRVLQRIARNDFEEPIFARYPELARLRAELQERGAIVSRLTGSGPALFAVFQELRTRDEAAASGLAGDGWTVVPTGMPGPAKFG